MISLPHFHIPLIRVFNIGRFGEYIDTESYSQLCLGRRTFCLPIRRPFSPSEGRTTHSAANVLTLFDASL